MYDDIYNDDEALDLKDIFTDDFMSMYTEFQTFEEFLYESPVEIESQEDFDQMDMGAMDAYVSEVTQFEAWEDMQGEAVSLYTINQLGL